MHDPPNVLLVLTDQHRGDAIGADPASPTDAEGEPIVHTPNVDSFIERGALFERAYTPVPSSLPARRCLLTGQTPATNGCPGWVTGDWTFDHTLPGELSRAGYQTGVVGKFDSRPTRNHCGFDEVTLQYAVGSGADDAVEYDEWLERRDERWPGGVDLNSWDARPSHLPESHHPTTWTTDRAIEFLERSDPTRPFFLQLAYYHPHRPFDPPKQYWDMYADVDLPDPYMGDWADEWYAGKLPAHPSTKAWCADLPSRALRRARIGYYGLITHIDHQLNRVLELLRNRGELSDTVIVFTSDHGEMLGDHYLGRKTYAFEGSARVPLLVRFADAMDIEPGRRIERPVGLEDLMPTILELAGADVPETVEGRSLLPLLAGDAAGWRTFYHGEHSPIYEDENAHQYLVDDRYKYVWNPVTGEELLFDLGSDPGEECDLSGDPDHRDALRTRRKRLVRRLTDRDEAFTDGDSLIACARESPIAYPREGSDAG